MFLSSFKKYTYCLSAENLCLPIHFSNVTFFSMEHNLCIYLRSYLTNAVQLLSHVRLFATLWTAARQVSMSITNFLSLLKLMSIEPMMPSNHLILYCPLFLLPSIFPSIRVFPVSWFFVSGSQTIGALASPSVLPVDIQD